MCLVMLMCGAWFHDAWALSKDSADDLSTSQIHISTVSVEKKNRLQLKVQGESHTSQTLQLLQNGLVFYEQQLQVGEVKLAPIVPVDDKAQVDARLQANGQITHQVVLLMQPKQQQTLQHLPPSSGNSAKSDGDDLEFDVDFLKGSAFVNLSPTDIKKLGDVRPGVMIIDVYRDDTPIGKFSVLFTAPPSGGSAKPCISADLFNRMNIKTAYLSAKAQAILANANSGAPARAQSADQCLYMEDWVSGASGTYYPGELFLRLSIPQAFLKRDGGGARVPPSMLTRGENAGFANYSFNHYQSSGLKSNFLGLSSGLNLGGWQLRQSSSVSQSTDAIGSKTAGYAPGEAYVRRPLIDMKANLSFGSIGSQSPILGGVSVLGAQLSSEEALMSDDQLYFRPVVRGVARTNARVNVLQNKMVFFEQNVPPGPFEFLDLFPPNSVGDLEVVVTEADGSKQTFVIPYSMSMGKLNPGTYRYSVTSGKFNSFGSYKGITLVQSYLRYGLTDWLSPGLEVFLANHYQAMGLQAAFNQTWGAITLNGIHARWQGLTPSTGRATSITYAAPAIGPFSLNAGLSAQSMGYVALGSAFSDSQLDPFNLNAFKNSRYFSVGMGLNQWGNLSLSAVEQNTWVDTSQTHQYRLGYSNRIASVGWSLSMDQITYNDGRKPIESLGITASIPLGPMGKNGNLSASFSQYDQQQNTQNVSYNGTAGDEKDINYNLSQSSNGSTRSSNGSVSYAHSLGSIGGSLSGSNGGTQQWGFNALGGVVLHSGGITLSPTLGPTFAIVELPNGEGALLPGSKSRINSRGYGVVPYLAPYYFNEIQVSLEGASTELELESALQKVAPVDGSIVRLKFNPSSGTPVLMNMAATEGMRIPIGTSITNSAGNEVGTVGQGNRALIRVSEPKDTLTVTWGDKSNQRCVIPYDLQKSPKAKDKNSYVRLDVMCNIATGSVASSATESGKSP